jgi:two-component system copper resistance phosphate regulon response regulator CusR
VKVASFLRQALEEEGYAVDTTGDGETGIQYTHATTYDLLILDWMLPKMSGINVCRALRKENCRIPILLLTARDAVADRISGLDTGADDYLTKPFSLGELFARVRALLRRGGPTLPTVLTVGDLTLDPATRRVERAGREILLSAKEYSLLEYLIRNAGRTVTRTLIAEHVWDFNFDSGTNVVDVYINYLRNKIDRGHPRPLIHTARGVGYRLESIARETTESTP